MQQRLLQERARRTVNQRKRHTSLQTFLLAKVIVEGTNQACKTSRACKPAQSCDGQALNAQQTYHRLDAAWHPPVSGGSSGNRGCYGCCSRGPKAEV